MCSLVFLYFTLWLYFERKNKFIWFNIKINLTFLKCDKLSYHTLNCWGLSFMIMSFVPLNLDVSILLINNINKYYFNRINFGTTPCMLGDVQGIWLEYFAFNLQTSSVWKLHGDDGKLRIKLGSRLIIAGFRG